MTDKPAQALSPAAQKYADEQRSKKPMKEDSADVAVRENAFAITGDEVIAFIERHERLIAEIAQRRDDRKQITAESKSRGYNPAIIARLIKLRSIDAAGHTRLREFDAELELYQAAIGMDFSAHGDDD